MAVPRKRLPRIPSSVPSVLGPVPVRLDPFAEKNEAETLGAFNFHSRSIRIRDTLPRNAAWQTLFHEMTHIALWDAGAHGQLTEKQEESVCDAVATYLAAAMQAGHITLKE
jgi:hypothetical protein